MWGSSSLSRLLSIYALQVAYYSHTWGSSSLSRPLSIYALQVSYLPCPHEARRASLSHLSTVSYLPSVFVRFDEPHCLIYSPAMHYSIISALFFCEARRAGHSIHINETTLVLRYVKNRKDVTTLQEVGQFVSGFHVLKCEFKHFLAGYTAWRIVEKWVLQKLACTGEREEASAVAFSGEFLSSWPWIMILLMFALRWQKFVWKSVGYFRCHIKFNFLGEPGGEVNSVSFPGRFGWFLLQILNVLVFELIRQKSVWQSVRYFSCYIKFNHVGGPGGEVNSISFPSRFWGSFLRIINVLVFELIRQKSVWQSVRYFSCYIKFNHVGGPGEEVNSVSFPGRFGGFFLQIVNVLIFESRRQKFVFQSTDYFSC